MKRLAIALLFFGSVSLGAQAVFPPLPTAVPSQIGAVRVVVVPGLKCGGVEALGCFNQIRRVISIADSLPLAVAWHTLEHEKVHVAFWDSGAHSLIGDEKTEDTIADAIASFRMMEMITTLLNKARLHQ